MYRRCTINFATGLDRTIGQNPNIFLGEINEYSDSGISSDIVIENICIVTENETSDNLKSSVSYEESIINESTAYTSDDIYKNDFTSLDNSNTYSENSKDNNLEYQNFFNESFQTDTERKQPTPVKVTVHEAKRGLGLPIRGMFPRSLDLSNSSLWHTKAVKKESIIKELEKYSQKSKSSPEDKTVQTKYDDAPEKNKDLTKNNDEGSETSRRDIKEYSFEKRSKNIMGSEKKEDKIKPRKFGSLSKAESKKDYRSPRNKKEKSEKKEKESKLMNLLFIFEIFRWLKDSDIIVRIIIAAIAGILVFGTIFSQLNLQSYF